VSWPHEPGLADLSALDAAAAAAGKG
jgi:hypothetical protein